MICLWFSFSCQVFLFLYLILPILAIIVLLTTTAYKSDFFEIAKQIEIFTTMFKELNVNYVDDTNPGDLMDVAIKSMLGELDPYTRFYNEQDVQSSRINNTGDYTGIGANVRTMKDKLVIVEPYKDYAADKAGLKAGDEIIKIDDINILISDFYYSNNNDTLPPQDGFASTFPAMAVIKAAYHQARSTDRLYQHPTPQPRRQPNLPAPARDLG